MVFSLPLEGENMSGLIPSYTITELKKLRIPEIKRLKSCEITSDGEYLFTVINPQTDFIKVQTEYAGQISNSVGGEDLDAIINKELAHAL